jgi:hypothetical protein
MTADMGALQNSFVAAQRPLESEWIQPGRHQSATRKGPMRTAWRGSKSTRKNRSLPKAAPAPTFCET